MESRSACRPIRFLLLLAVFFGCLAGSVRAAAPSVTADFGASVVGLTTGTGLLHGFNLNYPTTTPASNLIAPLRFSLWRQGTQDNPYYNRVTSFGARYEYVTSDAYRYPRGGNSIYLPGQNGDWTAYDQFLRTQLDIAVQNNHNMIWEFWNEPDLTFGDSKVAAYWPESKPLFLAAFARFSRTIRARLPNAMIAGPSPSVYQEDFLVEFLNYCKAQNVEVNALTWHEFPPDVRDIPKHIDFIRTNFIENPAYASLKLREIHINEYLSGGNEQYRPATILSYLYNFEDPRANPDGACKSCWGTLDGTQTNCFNGTLEGLLTTDSVQQPRGAWWAYKTYADGLSSRAPSTTNDEHLLPFASRATAQSASQAQLLVGYYDVFGQSAADTINVVATLDRLNTLNFLGAAPASVHVMVRKIPDTQEGALPSMPVVTEMDLPVSGGTARVTLPRVGLYEAWLITLSAPVSPGAAPIPAASAAPGGVWANGQVNLTWNPVAGATSYNLCRADSPGASPNAIYPGLTSTSFADFDFIPGRTYYYSVAAVSTGGAGPRSPEMRVTTPAPSTTAPVPPPAPWSSGDIGAPLVAGSSTYRDGEFTVNGAGKDIYGYTDQFQFVWQTLSGDGQIVARIKSVVNTNPWTKVGVMMRASFEDTSYNAFMALSKGGGAAFQWRGVGNGGTGFKGLAWPGAAGWVKLVRSGNSFSGYVSADGNTWSLVGTQNVPMSQAIYVGLAATSHAESVATSAVFQSVTVSAGTTQPPVTPPTPPTTPTTPTPPATSPLPSGWTGADVGGPAASGTSSYENGVFTIKGAGNDIWNPRDQFQFASQALTGDGELVAHITGVGNTDGWAKAGIMLRQNLGETSAYALMALTPGNGALFQWRTADGGNSNYQTRAWAAAPCWLKLTRSGSLFTAAVSADGSTWQTVGSMTATMTGTIYAGLAVTSHNGGAFSTATFDNVTLGAATTQPPATPPTTPTTPPTTPTTPTTPTPPAGSWADEDVGPPYLAGSSSQSGGVFTVRGAGLDIWNQNDEFHFVWQQLGGDGQIVARVTGVSDTDGWAKAGVMMRKGLGGGAAYGMMALSRSNGALFQWRAADGATSNYRSASWSSGPCWVKVTRAGNSLRGFTSSDGGTWSLVGEALVPMNQTIYLGLALTSHNGAALNTATFDGVAITSAPNP